MDIKEYFIPIDINTKPYVKAYIIHKLGSQPKLRSKGPKIESIGNKLFDLLQHKTNERGARKNDTRYTAILRIYIPTGLFKKLGQNLNETNLKQLNLFIELEVKQLFCNLMDDLMCHLPSFINNLPEVRRKLEIEPSQWSTEAMKQVYYRRNKNFKGAR
ncbi:hypothetical protein BH11BAC5_BH11BAC5_48590 [soil metagenome]